MLLFFVFLKHVCFLVWWLEECALKLILYLKTQGGRRAGEIQVGYYHHHSYSFASIHLQTHLESGTVHVHGVVRGGGDLASPQQKKPSIFTSMQSPLDRIKLPEITNIWENSLQHLYFKLKKSLEVNIPQRLLSRWMQLCNSHHMLSAILSQCQ